MALAALAGRGVGPRAVAPSRARPAPVLVVVDGRRATGAALSPGVFGLGVDLSAATYIDATHGCAVLPGIGAAVTLVRVGAAKADDYDWRTDTYYNQNDTRERGHDASFGCPRRGDRGAASVLRVLDRARALRAGAVVVLNGETDDPRSAYALAALVARRYGLVFARDIYWEIGNVPARWQHFGVPLTARSDGERIACSPDQYAALVTAYHAALAAALYGSVPGGAGGSSDKGGPRIVADAWIANATDQSWAGLVTAVDTRYYPYTSLGVAPPGAAAVAASVTNPPPGAVSLHDQLAGLRANLGQYNEGESIALFLGQWNIDANASAAYDPTAQAVFLASLLLHAARDGVGMAAWAPPLLYGESSSGPPGSSSTPQTPFVDGQPAPSLVLLTLLRGLAGAHALFATSSDPALDVLAVRRADGGISIVLARTGAHAPSGVSLRLSGGPRRPVRATLRTFPGRPDGAARALTFDPAGARIAVSSPGVAIVTLPAR